MYFFIHCNLFLNVNDKIIFMAFMEYFYIYLTGIRMNYLEKLSPEEKMHI